MSVDPVSVVKRALPNAATVDGSMWQVVNTSAPTLTGQANDASNVMR